MNLKRKIPLNPSYPDNTNNTTRYYCNTVSSTAGIVYYSTREHFSSLSLSLSLFFSDFVTHQFSRQENPIVNFVFNFLRFVGIPNYTFHPFFLLCPIRVKIYFLAYHFDHRS
jgi:hypothetical protein